MTVCVVAVVVVVGGVRVEDAAGFQIVNLQTLLPPKPPASVSQYRLAAVATPSVIVI